jgi:hypothetical protein
MSKCAVNISNSPPTGTLSSVMLTMTVVVDALQDVVRKMLAVARSAMLLRCHSYRSLQPFAASTAVCSRSWHF